MEFDQQLQLDRQSHVSEHHVVLLPFMAQGHMIPCMALASRLAACPATIVTVATTPANAVTLTASVPSTMTTKIQIHALPFHGPDFGLPPGVENTDMLGSHWLVIRLLEATLSLRPHFHKLLSNIAASKPKASRLTVVVDCFVGWAVEVAREVGASYVAAFTTTGGYSSTAFFSLWQHLPNLDLKDGERSFHVPGFPDQFRLHLDQISQALRSIDSEANPGVKYFQTQLNLSLTADVFLCNSVEDLEPEGMRLFRNYTKLPVWPVGPLFLDEGENRQKKLLHRAGKMTGISLDDCVAWLDSHRPESVIYICFGSMNTITIAQMTALATGLEASGAAFLWVVRPPIGFDLTTNFRDQWLPPGFEARTQATGRGLLIRNWAPQQEILAHPAVGGFLSHCGWNSSLEALSCGLPIIGWPMSGEQFYSSKMMVEELGVCLELARGVVKDISANAIEEVVREIIGGEKGREMRRRALALAEIIRAAMVKEPTEDGACCVKGSSVRALEEFVNFVAPH